MDSKLDSSASMPDYVWYPEDSEEFVELYGPSTDIPLPSSSGQTCADDVQPRKPAEPLTRTHSYANVATANLTEQPPQVVKPHNLTRRRKFSAAPSESSKKLARAASLVRTASYTNAATAYLSEKPKQPTQTGTAMNLTGMLDLLNPSTENLSEEFKMPPEATEPLIPADSYANAATINSSKTAKKPQLLKKQASLSQHPTRPSFSARRQVKPALPPGRPPPTRRELNLLSAVRFTLDNVQYMYCALCTPLQTRLPLDGGEISDHLLRRHNLDEQVANGAHCQWPRCWFAGASTKEDLHRHYLDVHFQNAMPIDFNVMHSFLRRKRANGQRRA